MLNSVCRSRTGAAWAYQALWFCIAGALALVSAVALAQPRADWPSRPQVRGTWLTTTANDALASPEHTARTMRRLREIGLNTVYIEAWKNGYTQFPSEVLQRTIGVAQRPSGVEQDPADTPRLRHARSLRETFCTKPSPRLTVRAWWPSPGSNTASWQRISPP